MNRKQRRAAGPSAELQKAFSEALRRHQAGDLRDAEERYRQILAVDPRHSDSLHLLGVIASQEGHHDLAIEMIRKAIALDGKVHSYHSNLGFALQAQGQLEQAAACYRKALSLRPDFPEAHNNLGNALRALGRLDEAAACYRKTIGLRPDDAETHGNLGLVLLAQGRLDEAIVCFRQALALNPNDPEAHNTLGTALQRLGRTAEAAACYRQALDLWPDDPQAHFNLGTTLQERGRLEAAVLCYRQSLERRPDSPPALNNLGNALRDLGRLDEAIACFHKILALRPDDPEALNNLGSALQKQDWPEEAIPCFRRALALRPDFPEALYNLGGVLQEVGQQEEAVACYHRTLALKPDFPEAHLNYAFALLQEGRFLPGWDEYEWRWRCRDVQEQAKPRHSSRPAWSGETAQGGTILLWAEQGSGDAIQFVRYGAAVAQRGWRVVVEAPVALKRLFDTLPDVTVVRQGDALPPFDVQCSLLSLPRVFGTTAPTIPAPIPYLRADPALVREWRERLSSRLGFKVGVAWRGNPSHRRDRKRSMDPAWFARFLDVPGLTVVSLQKEATPAECAALGARGPVLDAGPQLGDFADTAALVSQLDLVISVDTSVCHLAGALAVPTWTLLDFDPDWRWLRDRETSPWYPTLRLFRQPRPGDWQAVVETVRAALCLTAEHPSNNNPPAA